MQGCTRRTWRSFQSADLGSFFKALQWTGKSENREEHLKQKERCERKHRGSIQNRTEAGLLDDIGYTVFPSWFSVFQFFCLYNKGLGQLAAREGREKTVRHAGCGCFHLGGVRPDSLRRSVQGFMKVTPPGPSPEERGGIKRYTSHSNRYLFFSI